MPALESRCLWVMGGGVLVSRTLPNCLNKVCVIALKYCYISKCTHNIIQVKQNNVACCKKRYTCILLSDYLA